MARYKLLISYDGTDFCGWQKQKDHKHGPELPSIQQTIEQALKKLFSHPVSVSASGRTDAGVHAVGQVCHFETEKNIPRDLCWALRGILPQTISAKALWLAPDDFHSTISAVSKTYRYWIWNHPRSPALMGRYSWWIRSPLETESLNQYAAKFIGEHDFASFRSMGTEVKHTVRRITSATWTQRKPGLFQFEVTGNGFMKQMVRNLVGTQLDLCLKSQAPEIIEEILNKKDRQAAGTAAPPQGLFLYRVFYPKILDSQCRRL